MIPYGYKQTEVGVIPEDWECTTAKQLMKIETGSRNTENKTNTGIYPFFVRSQKIESIDTYHYNCEAVLTAGDGVGTGKVFHYCIGKFDAHQRVYVMSGFNGISGRYFYYYFSENFEKEVSKYTAKSSVDSVRHDMIAEMKIPLPPLPEQQRIAEALSDVDGMISSLEKLVAKYKSIKTACLQQMFTQNGETVPRMRFPGFTGAWEQRKYGEVVETRRGFTYKPSENCDSVIRVLRTSNIDEDTFVLKADDVFVKKDAANIDYSKENDILITSANGSSRLVGKHAIISSISGNPAVHGGFMLLGTTKEPYFINASMGSSWYRRFIELYVAGGNGAIGNLNKNDLDNQAILIPSEPEQRAIGAFFKQLDHLITLHQRKLEKVQKIKQGMMQQLLTGKIRLV